MSEREQEILDFMEKAGWGGATRTRLAEDASYRSYQRVAGAKGRAMLMNAPIGGDQSRSPQAAAYNRVAHLATDCRSFAAYAAYLRSLGLSAPEIFAADLPRGLLLLEDFGDDLFFQAIPDGADETTLYEAAIDVLLRLHTARTPETLPVGDGSDFVLSQYDPPAMLAEAMLLCEWYVPQQTGGVLSAAVREEFQPLWAHCLGHLNITAPVLVLRDYHAQNLFWLPHRTGVARVGLIDFQDGLLGSPAYDLVSLLEDARRDVAPELAARMLDYYCAKAKAVNPGFDAAAFRTAYAITGAQRNCKILGIFARLAKRDGKPGYLQSIPRVQDYLRHDLTHPELAALKGWLEKHLGF